MDANLVAVALALVLALVGCVFAAKEGLVSWGRVGGGNATPATIKRPAKGKGGVTVVRFDR
jgi:hypothetical protein